MFSIFDYLRRRTCDSMLAGAYDALEILESEKSLTVAAPAEIAGGNNTANQNSLPQPVPAPSKVPGPLQIVAPQRPAPATIPQKIPSRPQQQPHKTPQPPQGQAGKLPPPPSEKKPAAATPVVPNGLPAPPVQKTAPPPPSDLFNGATNQEKPLPPRKRGRPRKYPPGGNMQ
jgi:hypothetical protein